jgi:hypothetical protein
VRERVEAESEKAKRFLGALRDILEVPKAELDKRIKREKRKRQRRGGSQKAKNNKGQR